MRTGSKKKADALPPLADTLVPAQRGDSLEADELWSFVLRKTDKAWIWIVISFQTRQVIAAVIGDRSAETCWKLWCQIPVAYRKKLVYTDFYEACFAIIPEWQHRPSPKGSGRTNTAERFHLTLRQRLARFVRKTLSFSKSWRMHHKCLMLFLHQYNWDCIKRFKLVKLAST